MSLDEPREYARSAMFSPAATLPPRQPRSARRTSHIDMLLGKPGDNSPLTLAGAARDLVSSQHGTEAVAGSATVRATVAPDGTLTALTIEPHAGDPARLLGRSVGAGFRDAVHDAFPDDAAAATPLALLLDDLPVATLISGYARLYRGDIPAPTAAQTMKSDICSGWRADGTMMTSIHAGLGVPVTVGPPAPRVADETGGDELAWHAMGPLPTGAMRRRRLVDVRDGGDRFEVRAMFRDTHTDPGGRETVLHEYTLTASIEAAGHTFTRCQAVPRVLPYVECPVAAASADRIVGLTPADVREFVRREVRGTTTCTHLNDLLRSLGDIDRLIAIVHAAD